MNSTLRERAAARQAARDGEALVGNARSSAYQDGWNDALDQQIAEGHHRLMVRWLSELLDEELSDYWEGWHQAPRPRASKRRKNNG